jgi:hypothetical protein
MPKFANLRKRIALRLLAGQPLNPPPPELEPIQPEHLAELQSLFPLPKFFIFGYPRSGTTLLMRLIALHPEVHCSREAHFFTRADDATRVFASNDVRAWLERRANRWTSGKNLETAMVRLAADYILEREARQVGKKIVGDKTPNGNGGQAVKRLKAIYPEARLIYIVRDGRDAALSHRFQHFIDHPEFLDKEDLAIRQDFSTNSQPFFDKQRSVFTEKAIRSEASSWASNVNDTHRLGQDLYGDRYASLCYESLLADPLSHMRRLWTFLGAEPDFPEAESKVLAMLDYNPGAEAQKQKDSDLASKLPRGREGAWRQLFTSRDRQVFQTLAGETLKAWGYPED